MKISSFTATSKQSTQNYFNLLQLLLVSKLHSHETPKTDAASIFLFYRTRICTHLLELARFYNFLLDILGQNFFISFLHSNQLFVCFAKQCNYELIDSDALSKSSIHKLHIRMEESQVTCTL